MTQIVFIPKGMQQIEQLATMKPHLRARVELTELHRLHDLASPNLDSSILRSVPAQHFPWRMQVFSGEVHLPISGYKFRLTSPLWGEINLADLADPKSYHSNVGYIRFARDIGVLIGCKKLPGYPCLHDDLPEHFGGSSKFVAEWRKSLYLLQLAESQKYVQQFAGLDGLDAFALRYFNGNVSNARSFAINIFSQSIFETLGWKTARTARAQLAYRNRQRDKIEANYERILAWADEIHRENESMLLEAFVKRLLRLDDRYEERPRSAQRGSPFRRFGKIRRSLREGGIDTSELDNIFSQHGLGYREAPALYEEFLRLAREDHLSTEQLSRIAIERGMVARLVRIAYSRGGFQILLEAFHDYGVETDELAPLLVANAPEYIAGRIREWRAKPKPRGSLFIYLGLTMLQDQSFQRWVEKYIGEPEHGIVSKALRQREALQRSGRKGPRRRSASRSKNAGPSLADMKRNAMPTSAKRRVPDEGTSTLDVFADLIVDNKPPLDVEERLEDAMEPLERIKGRVPPERFRRLKDIFVRELGADVVDAALIKAGIKID